MKDSTLGVSDFQYKKVLRKVLPDRLLKQAIEQTSKTQRSNAKLPAFLVLASLIAWFFDAVVRLPGISAWLCHRPDDLPSDSAIYQTRDRIGWAPIRWLCQRVLRPLAVADRDPTAFYKGHRLLGVDGTVLTVADTPANEHTFGRARNQKGSSGYPLLRLVALCELGTHALIGWVARGFKISEQSLAARLYPRVPAGALLLLDRNFHCHALWQAAQEGHWHLLARLQKGPKFPVDQVLGDGSYRSWVYPSKGKNRKEQGILVRVIDYRYSDEEGKERTGRLLTNLLDALQYPAQELVEVYHQRWEQEGVFKEIKSVLKGRTTHLRSEKPLRVVQELDGLLLGHWVLRTAILEAARTAGVPAVEISFTGALRVLRKHLLTEKRKKPRREQSRGATGAKSRSGLPKEWEALLQAMGQQRLQKRRKRCCPRKKKLTRSAWPPKRKEDKEHPVPSFEILTPTKPLP